MSDSEQTHDTNELLQTLETYGKQFLSSFDIPQAKVKRKDSPRKARETKKKRKLNTDPNHSSGSEPEWTGFSHKEEELLSDSEEASISQDHSLNAGFATQKRHPDVVVFAHDEGRSDPSNSKVTKAQMKAFMSSKVSKVTREVSEEDDEEERKADGELELSNLQNDALLHRLVHTKILSGSLNPDLDLKPSKRRKALAGRVLEVAGKTKLGKGETAVRVAERNKAAKHVRDGLVSKQKERSQRALEEAKHMGNYHPTLKGLHEASSHSANRKREKGLKMGVGSFGGGVLKLSKKELASAQGLPSRSQGKRRR